MSVSWLERLANRVRPFMRRISRAEYVSCRVRLHPEDSKIDFGVVYVVAVHNQMKWAYFRCPCRHHDIVRLNLNPSVSPQWTVSASFLGGTTICPSIRQTDGCLSHFWIKSGRVHWCKDSGMRLRKPHEGIRGNT